jgi:hypothetical protein
MAQEPTKKKSKINFAGGSDWEGLVDSMISGGAADSAAKAGGGLLTDLANSLSLSKKDPALHGDSPTKEQSAATTQTIKEPTRLSDPNQPAPAAPVSAPPLDPPPATETKNQSFLKSLLKLVGLV